MVCTLYLLVRPCFGKRVADEAGMEKVHADVSTLLAQAIQLQLQDILERANKAKNHRVSTYDLETYFAPQGLHQDAEEPGYRLEVYNDSRAHLLALAQIEHEREVKFQKKLREEVEKRKEMMLAEKFLASGGAGLKKGKAKKPEEHAPLEQNVNGMEDEPDKAVAVAKKKPGKAKPAANTAAKPTKMPKISSKQRALMVSADEQTLKTGTTALKATGRGLKDWQIAGGSAANLAMTSLRTKPFVPENKIYKRDVMDVLKEDYDQAPPVKRRMLQSTVFRHWRGV